MKFIRFTLAFIGFLVGWIGVAILIGLLMSRLFPGTGTDHNVFGDWRSWPGGVLGVFVGYWLFQLLAGTQKEKKAR